MVAKEPADGLARFTSAMTPMPGSRRAAITSSGGGAAAAAALIFGQADAGFAHGSVGPDSLKDGVEHVCRAHACRSSHTVTLHRHVTAPLAADSADVNEG